MRMTSTIFTVGTLLSRAQDAGVPVRVLVEGNWIGGTPVDSDGHGVVIDSPAGQVLVRMGAISAVAYAPVVVEDQEQPVDVTPAAEEPPSADPEPSNWVPRDTVPHDRVPADGRQAVLVHA
jgi:hypothetical protein